MEKDNLIKKQKLIRKETSLFRAPLYTIKILFISLYEDILQAILYFKHHISVFITVLALIVLGFFVWITPGSHQQYVEVVNREVGLMVWWVGLGVLSSIGLGTGLHTFLLYTGPFIAQVTLAATECKSTNFERYGPDRFLCPSDPTSSSQFVPSISDILPLVWWEAFLWGSGTALGELPPYFVARAARISGKKLESIEKNDDGLGDDDDKESDSDSSSITAKLGNYVDQFLNQHFARRGFFLKFIMIMLFASVPNPLFDLAGLTCGYQLIPFFNFFIPTLIGKGIIKVTIQAVFVIIVFNKDTLEWILSTLELYIPFISSSVKANFDAVRQQFHKMPGEQATASPQKPSLAIVWDLLLAGMILYFVVSLVDSKVQEYLIKQHMKEIEDLENEIFSSQASPKKPKNSSTRPTSPTKKTKIN
eukprot:TRINITY_DN4372_c1_g3_i1.p1 TRINITY_DN4372_c1_g3~~TRINITY_DN4372_c1_g3_i1.p1  ORF type:complete len:420 (+),score=97.33 TRINITY_DN4372_c1_g3_i1:19-1278(+)